MQALMMKADQRWSVSNAGPEAWRLWLEPWAEEFVVPGRSTIVLEAIGGSDDCASFELDWTSEHLVAWASGSTVRVFIDEVLQDSASATIPVPAGLTKEVLNIVFSGHPAARLGGAGG